MPSDYVICVRDVARGKFVAEPGATLYLEIPESSPDQTSANPLTPKHAIARDVWFRKVMADSMRGINAKDATEFGDVLVFVHGYNNDQKVVMQRHRQLSHDLRAMGYEGVVVSFDWPSDDKALNYIEDRSDAKATALALVDDAITAFARYQQDDCRISVHLLGHSTGAYVIREAFDDADDRKALASRNWMVSQVLFIGADVSAGSMSASNATGESLFRHTVRLTNYSNAYDSVLKLSNVKRLGIAPRVGRVGLPEDAPGNSANVDCGDYFQTLNEKTATFYGTFCHSWHIGDKTFAADLLETIYGDAGRDQIRTREPRAGGGMKLKAIG